MMGCQWMVFDSSSASSAAISSREALTRVAGLVQSSHDRSAGEVARRHVA
jgi:hypothetical protein